MGILYIVSFPDPHTQQRMYIANADQAGDETILYRCNATPATSWPYNGASGIVQ